MSKNIITHDFIAIGLGPFNLGLACLSDPVEGLQGIFLEKKSKFDWHPGMMLQDTTLQIPFMADLVTLADPTNPYSFLNYIKSTGRIYSFYIKEDFLLLRKEYNQYCQWVITQLDNIYFNTNVEHIDFVENDQTYVVTAKSEQDGSRTFYKTKKLILGIGTSPFIPECAKKLQDKISHTANYLFNKERIQQQKAITIVGSGQSAAEVYYDLLQEIDIHKYELNWITRSPRYFPLEYSKLTLEMTSPEYVDYFHSLPLQKREQLNKESKNLYKGINQDLIAAIFDLLYVKKLDAPFNSQLRTNSELKSVQETANNSFELIFHQTEQDKHYKHKTEEIILATGYQPRIPDFVEGIKSKINWDEKQRFAVNRNYSIDDNNSIFVQNAELHTHGFVSPDLGMGAYRNSYIINELTGREIYSVESKIAFQQFDVKKDEEVYSDEIITVS